MAAKIKCPRCAYPLLRLPEVHTCPECGLPYDPHSRMFRLVRAYRRMGLVLPSLFLMAVIVAGASRLARISAMPALAGYFLICALWPCARWIFSLGSVHRVHLTHAGIQFEHPALPSELIRWSDFERAEIRLLTGQFRILDPAGRVLVRCSLTVFGPYAVARSRAEEFNRLARVYAAASAEPSRGDG